MSETKTHEVLINRTWIGVLQYYFRMKGITNHRTLHNDHGELKPYEKQFGRELTRMDAIIISPLTESEITEIIDGYYENEELRTELFAYIKQESKRQAEIYFRTYGKEP